MTLTFAQVFANQKSQSFQESLLKKTILTLSLFPAVQRCLLRDPFRSWKIHYISIHMSIHIAHILHLLIETKRLAPNKKSSRNNSKHNRNQQFSGLQHPSLKAQRSVAEWLAHPTWWQSPKDATYEGWSCRGGAELIAYGTPASKVPSVV